MVCLDTTFLIDVLRGNKEVQDMKDRLDWSGESITVAVPSVMEITKGLILGKNKPNEKQRSNELLSSILTLDLNRESAVLAGKIEADLVIRGECIDVEDVMIAAIAMVNNEKLVTRNVNHFGRIRGLDIEGY